MTICAYFVLRNAIKLTGDNVPCTINVWCGSRDFLCWTWSIPEFFLIKSKKGINLTVVIFGGLTVKKLAVVTNLMSNGFKPLHYFFRKLGFCKYRAWE